MLKLGVLMQQSHVSCSNLFERLCNPKPQDDRKTPEKIVRRFADEFLKENETFYPLLRLILAKEVGAIMPDVPGHAHFAHSQWDCCRFCLHQT
jgi:hypothetical protein